MLPLTLISLYDDLNLSSKNIYCNHLESWYNIQNFCYWFFIQEYLKQMLHALHFWRKHYEFNIMKHLNITIVLWVNEYAPHVKCQVRSLNLLTFLFCFSYHRMSSVKFILVFNLHEITIIMCFHPFIYSLFSILKNYCI